MNNVSDMLMAGGAGVTVIGVAQQASMATHGIDWTGLATGGGFVMALGGLVLKAFDRYLTHVERRTHKAETDDENLGFIAECAADTRCPRHREAQRHVARVRRTS